MQQVPAGGTFPSHRTLATTRADSAAWTLARSIVAPAPKPAAALRPPPQLGRRRRLAVRNVLPRVERELRLRNEARVRGHVAALRVRSQPLPARSGTHFTHFSHTSADVCPP